MIASTTELESSMNFLYKFQLLFFPHIEEEKELYKIKSEWYSHSLRIIWYNLKGMLFLHTFETL